MRSNATARRPAARIAGRSAARPAPRPLERSAMRVVNDRRWMHRNQLEIGMYVSELDRPWIETSFLFQGFRIDDGDVLRAVQDACEHVRVDTKKLARVSTRSPHRLVGTSLRARADPVEPLWPELPDASGSHAVDTDMREDVAPCTAVNGSTR